MTERQKMDFNDKDNLLKTLQCFKLFSDDAGPALQNIVTKDIVTVNIENDLLMAHHARKAKIS